MRYAPQHEPCFYIPANSYDCMYYTLQRTSRLPYTYYNVYVSPISRKLYTSHNVNEVGFALGVRASASFELPTCPPATADPRKAHPRPGM